MMRRAEIVGALVSTAVGLIIVSQARELEYWMPMGPGPGFVPLWSGIVIALAGIVLLVRQLRSPRQARPAGKQKGRPGMVGLVAAMTILAALGMNLVGFAATTFLFVSLLIWISGHHRFLVIISVAGGVTILFLLIFKWGLQVPLPTGYFGI